MKTNNEYRSDREVLERILEFVEIIAKAMSEPKQITARDIGLISDKDLMRILGISEKTTRAMRNDKTLRYITIGRFIFYKMDDVEAMIREKLSRS
jgi:DNA-binding Xre family transcriptional regulator